MYMDEELENQLDEPQNDDKGKPAKKGGKKVELVAVQKRGVTVYRSGKALEKALLEGWKRVNK